jgi:capsular exopolysaccharide synthesis family protein
LIDCDLRSPSIHDIFSLNGVGLSNFLIGNSDLIDAIYGSKFRNLYLMPAGFSTLHPVELISSNGMRSLLTNMKEKFDYIIIDTPPVGLFTEAQVLSQLTDGCLMVVSAKESDRKMSLKAVKLIQYAEGRILGALLNKSADSK